MHSYASNTLYDRVTLTFDSRALYGVKKFAVHKPAVTHRHTESQTLLITQPRIRYRRLRAVIHIHRQRFFACFTSLLTSVLIVFPALVLLCCICITVLIVFVLLHY